MSWECEVVGLVVDVLSVLVARIPGKCLEVKVCGSAEPAAGGMKKVEGM